MFQSLKCRDYLTEQPVIFSPETNIFNAIHELIYHKVSGGTVVDSNRNVVGVISDVDCLGAILQGSYHGDINGTVGQYMTTEVETVGSDTNVVDVATKMIANNRRRMPVIENGKFIGQLSVRSILKVIKDFDVPKDPSERRVY